MADLKSLGRSKPVRIAAAGVGGVVALSAAAGLAQSLFATSPGVISACVGRHGALRVLGADGASCQKDETPIQWNQLGPIGPQGPQGLQGLQGEMGAPGIAGPPGAPGTPGSQGLPGRDGRDGRDGTSGSGTSALPVDPCTPTIGSTSGSEIFVFVDGAPGESLDSTHKGWIDTLSFGWAGVANAMSPSSGGGAGAGKSQVGPFCFVKNVDKATPPLLRFASQGQHIKEVLVTFRKAGKAQLEYLKYKFEDVFVSSVQPGGGGVLPGEEVTLNFAQVSIDYCPTLADGTLGACSNVVIDTTNPAL